MAQLIILLAGLAAVLGWTSFRYRRRWQCTEAAITAIGPVLARQQNPEVLSALCGAGDWRTVLAGGQNHPGIHANEGRCPGRLFYTVSTRQTLIVDIPLSRWLKFGKWNPCTTGYPQPAPPEGCPEECVPVCTHRWNGWTIAFNLRTSQYVLNANTYAQYRCLMPGSPDLNKAPNLYPPDQLERPGLI
ncbi:MAG: hypothetical protein LC114_27185 [Bryobacterales bacterium]|nr:hypothetical protein [Bryobacterales bacterium]